ncbi:MAG: hypothetical protein KBT13_10515, partial [Bacteroidales bacterium]|nr:hypothetical protein [Candidatus Sodaliphilus limicaballi]
DIGSIYSLLHKNDSNNIPSDVVFFVFWLCERRKARQGDVMCLGFCGERSSLAKSQTHDINGDSHLLLHSGLFLFLSFAPAFKA